MSGDGTLLLGEYAGKRMLDWALDYAAQGWHVFQMRKGTKSFYGNCPRCKPDHDLYDADKHAQGAEHCDVHPGGYGRCHGLWSATRDPDVIRQWWTEDPHGNIGINCGRSGIACVDTDIKHHKGKFGDQSMAALEAKHGAFPLGPRATTASGGWHWVFKLPEGHALRSSTGSTHINGSKSGLADHIDIKALGGLMVAAPSLIFDDTIGQVTGQYTWNRDAGGEIPELPSWVMDEIAERTQRKITIPSPYTPGSFSGGGERADHDEVMEQVYKLADEVATAPAGGRNDLLLRNAKQAFQYAEAGQVAHHEVQFTFEQATLASGMDKDDFHTITNARRYAQGKPYEWKKRFGAREAQQQYDSWKGVPAPATASHDRIESATVAVVSADDEEGKEGTGSLTDIAVYGNGAGPGGGGDAPSDDRAFLDEVRDYEPNHLGQARYFCDIDGAKLTLRWNLSAGTFMKYDLGKGYWRQDDTKYTLTASDLSRLGIKITDATNREIKFSPEMELISQSFKEKVPKEKVAQAKAIITAKKAWPKLYGAAAGVQGILTFTRTLVDQCDALSFDKASGLLNFANGTYDVTTGKLRQHSMNDMLTHQVDYDLDMGLAEKPLAEVAPHFHRLITRMCAAPGEVAEDVHEKRVAAVLRLLGYSLHGSNPEKKMAVLVGGTNIGKNQAIEVVGQLLGNRLAWLGARPQLLIEGKGERHDSDEYGLAGKRMVLVNEMKEGQVLDEGQVLRFVGPEGTVVGLRKMRQDREDHWITWKMFVTTNELPRSRMTPQILSRLIVLPLSEVPVPDEEQYDIKAAIMEKEGPAVLAHLVREWSIWYTTKNAAHSPTGLVISDDMSSAKETYRTSNRPLALEFMDECTEKGEGIPVTSASEFWGRFQQWLKQEHPNLKRDEWPGRNAFYAEIRALDGQDGVAAVMENKGGGRMQFRGLRGVRLLPQSLASMNQRFGGF